MFDFRRINTILFSETPLKAQNDYIFQKFGGAWPLLPTPMDRCSASLAVGTWILFCSDGRQGSTALSGLAVHVLNKCSDLSPQVHTQGAGPFWLTDFFPLT